MSYRDEDRRDRERSFWGDVVYEVWRNGGDSDRVDRDTTSEEFREGLSADDSAARELHRQHPLAEEYFDEQEQAQ